MTTSDGARVKVIVVERIKAKTPAVTVIPLGVIVITNAMGNAGGQ